MPLIIGLLRQVVLYGLTYLATVLAEKTLLPLVNGGIEEIMVKFGVDEETAKDIMANEIIKISESILVGALVLKTKLPLKVADRLGFTTKGWKIRTIQSSKAARLPQIEALSIRAAASTSAVLETIASSVAKARTLNSQLVKEAFNFVMKYLDKAFIGALVILNFIDFGNWNGGAYQRTMQKVIEVVSFGLLTPDEKLPSSKVLSEDMWKRIYNTYIEAGAVGINDPFKLQMLPFTRENLLVLVDQVAANMAVEGQTPSYKNVMAITTALVVLQNEKVAASNIVETGKSTSQPSIRVVTGIVSQGKLAAATDFVPREDDLISSSGELKTAAVNNLAPFLASLPGRVTYEIRIKSSIRTRDGFEKRGTVQTVQTGSFADGTPRTKRVVNKFAVMSLFLSTDKGSRSKITEIVLGPTDAVAFQPAEGDLALLAEEIQSTIATPGGSIVQTQLPQNIKVENAPTLATAATSSAQSESAGAPARIKDTLRIQAQPGTYIDWQGWFGRLYRRVGNAIYMLEPADDLLSEAEKKNAGSAGKQWELAATRLRRMGVDIDALPKVKFSSEIDGRYAVVGPLPFEEFFGVAPRTESTAPKGCDAASLSQWYTANGTALPPLDERAVMYENLGLGQAAYYVGTAEQNVKLLGALKSRAGCPVT